MTATVTINTPQLDAIARRLSPSMRASLHADVADELQNTVQRHLRLYSTVHHKTADALGARPTGNLEKAPVVATSSSDGATVTVYAPGIRRALGPLTITPRNKAALTIPVAAIAYGRTVDYLVQRGIEVFHPKGKNYLATTEGKGKNAKVVPLYILAKRATLKHEPDILPTQDELTRTALAAAREYIMEGQP